MKELFLIRGLPGSGKSTFARKLADALGCLQFEADHWFYGEDGVYRWQPTKVHIAHMWCLEETANCLMRGQDCVVSNTFTTEKELKPYLAMADTYGYNVTTLIVENRHDGVSVHDVPRETIDKMRNRFSVKL